MDVVFKQKKMVNIEYPGVVKNVGKMLETLGGEEQISKVYNDPQKRLELRFRSSDPYCKCAHGDRFNTTNLLLRVVVPKKHGQRQSDKMSVEVLGTISLSFKFKGMMDFQILPMERSDEKYKSLLPQLVPTGLPDASWLKENVPLFILPQFFSRFDVPYANFYKSDVQPRNPVEKEKVQLPPNVIGRTRQRRAGFAIFANFEDKEIASSPLKQAIAQLKIHPCDPQLSNRIKQAFEERPIWSRNALSVKIRCDKVRLKYILPTVAYHFSNGPWRTLWVKFGYDPRRDSFSKIYQTLDFRLSAFPENKSLAKVQRNIGRCCSFQVKSNQNQPSVSVIKTDGLQRSNSDSNENVKSDIILQHEFHSGCLPVNRQSFYQLCDIHLDEVQRLIHVNDGREISVHEKDGWCESGILDRCRELINQDIKNTMDAMKAAASLDAAICN